MLPEKLKDWALKTFPVKPDEADYVTGGTERGLKWGELKRQIQNKIRSDPESPFIKMIDKGEEVVLVDKDGQEYKIVPSLFQD